MSEVQSALLSAKEVQLKNELAMKDQKIAEAGERASKADERAGLANKTAGFANERAEKLELESAEANRRVEELRQNNVLAAAQLETERKKRVELAASLLPRDFPDQSGAELRLHSLPPMTTVFEFIDEREPTSIAEQINAVLADLHWPTSRRPPELPIRDGIAISPGTNFVPPDARLTSEELRQDMELRERQRAAAESAAKPLRDEFLKQGLDAEITNDAFDFPPTYLLIRVGVKPNHALENTLKELGPAPEPTPLNIVGGNLLMGGNRLAFK